MRSWSVEHVSFVLITVLALAFFSYNAQRLVRAAVSALLYRRIVVKPRRLQGDKVHSGDAIFILSMIAGLMITLLLLGAFVAALAPGQASAFTPVSFLMGRAVAGFPQTTL